MLPAKERNIGVRRMGSASGESGYYWYVCGISMYCVGVLGASLFGCWGVGVLFLDRG